MLSFLVLFVAISSLCVYRLRGYTVFVAAPQQLQRALRRAQALLAQAT
jgi:hypothetical protein